MYRSIAAVGVALAAVTTLAPISAPAQAPAPAMTCAADAPQPWRAAKTIQSATSAQGASAAPFGEAVLLRLQADKDVTYVGPARRATDRPSFGGVAEFTIERAGIYRVVLNENAWIDVIEDGKVIESGRFGPGGPCSGYRKHVQFDLKPGRHQLEISGNEDADLGVWVTPFGS